MNSTLIIYSTTDGQTLDICKRIAEIINTKSISKIASFEDAETLNLSNYKKIIIEKFIPGREIQAAIIGSKKLGAIELKPRRKFYDYQAKYNLKAKTKHIIPVDLNNRDYKKLMNLALKAHKLIRCQGVTRSDFKFYNGKFYLLEINTQPGMTNLSLVPEIAAYHGINFLKLIELILKNCYFKFFCNIFCCYTHVIIIKCID